MYAAPTDSSLYCLETPFPFSLEGKQGRSTHMVTLDLWKGGLEAYVWLNHLEAGSTEVTFVNSAYYSFLINMRHNKKNASHKLYITFAQLCFATLYSMYALSVSRVSFYSKISTYIKFYQIRRKPVLCINSRCF